MGSSKPNPKKPATKVAAKPAPAKKPVAPAKKAVKAAPAAKAAASAKPAPAAKAAPAKKPAAKAVPPKPVSVGKPAAKAAPVKKAAEAAKKPAPPAAKGKKEEKPAAPVAAKAAVAKAPGTVPAQLVLGPKGGALGKTAAPAVKGLKPAAPVKPPAAAKPPAVKKPKKAPVVLGPMEKAQRSLAATAARAAAKDKVPPSKALAAVKEAQAKAANKVSTITSIEAKVAPAKKSSKIFFHEVQPGAERIIKRGDKTTATPIPADVQSRRRGGGGEESPEELVERIERELENQHIFKRNMLRPQLCTKCGINQVSERFTIDKELGYCDDCAEILHLGETKEARKIDFHPSLMKKDGEPAAEGAEEDEDGEVEPPKGPVPEID